MAEQPSESTLPRNEVPQVGKKRRVWIYVAILIGLILIGVAVVFVLQMQAVNGVSVSLTKFSTTNTFLVFTADTEFQISNKGLFDVGLREVKLTFFINGINVQTKNFAQDVMVIAANYYYPFTGTIETV